MNKIKLFVVLICLRALLQANTDSLKDAYARYFKIGTSVSPPELGQGGNFIKKHFNSITPENELKPDAILNQQQCQQKGNNVNTQVHFGSGTSQTLKFCEDNGIALRGHTFVWHSQTPDWFFRQNFNAWGGYVSKDIMNQRLENFIKNTFALIKSQFPRLNVYAYDVCNEIFKDGGGGLRDASNSNWIKVYGDDSFVFNAFSYARKYAPSGCKLFLNDFNEYMTAKTNDIVSMANRLKQYGLIDGIGMQSHLSIDFPSAAMYSSAVDRFVATGLEIQITELDIGCKDEYRQSVFFKDIFSIAIKNSARISSLTVWGTNDSISWRKNDTPLLFAAGYKAKGAYYAVMDLV